MAEKLQFNYGTEPPVPRTLTGGYQPTNRACGSAVLWLEFTPVLISLMKTKREELPCVSLSDWSAAWNELQRFKSDTFKASGTSWERSPSLPGPEAELCRGPLQPNQSQYRPAALTSLLISTWMLLGAASTLGSLSLLLKTFIAKLWQG